MSDTKVVVFTENNARILTNPPDLERYKEMPNARINPKLHAVKGVPPHLWKIDHNGFIVPMTAEESSKRLSHHKKNEIANKIIFPDQKLQKVNIFRRFWNWLRGKR